MLKHSLSANKTLVIETSVVTLHGAQLILNGVPLEESACELPLVDNEQIELRYTSASLFHPVSKLPNPAWDTVLVIKINLTEARFQVTVLVWHNPKIEHKRPKQESDKAAVLP